jgi:hypothetical protein
MIVDRTLLITGRQTPVLFQPIAQPFYPLAETVDGPLKGTGPICILLPRDGDTDTVASPGLPHLSTTGGFGPHQTTRSAFGAPALSPLHRSACPQGFAGHRVVPWARGEDPRHQLPPAFRAAMDFRPEAALTATERFGLCAPAVGASRVLRRSDDSAINIVAIPVQVLCGIRTLLDRSKEASPDASLPPPRETARHGAPRTIPLWQITPGGAGTEEPQETVEEASVGRRWAASVRFLRRKHGL